MTDPYPPSRIPRPRRDRCDPARPDYDLIVAAHETAVARAEPTYRDPTTGFSVLTVATLLSRGVCCAKGCRHCPFET